MSLKVLWRRNLAFVNLAVASNLEYRFNYLIDAILQPSITVLIEMALWAAIFRATGTDTINGYTYHQYLSYVLWAAFFARIATNWMYEFRMIEEIESGAINGILVRPVSFYEYYLSQLMGYKGVTTVVSFLIPLIASILLGWSVQLSRLPLAIALIVFYLFLVHSISFSISCLAFFFNRVHSLTMVKNLCLWTFTGELFPLDLLPENIRSLFLLLPFSSGVYLPVGYLTGRVTLAQIQSGFVSVTIGLVVVNLLGYLLWKKGLQSYVGTGA